MVERRIDFLFNHFYQFSFSSIVNGRKGNDIFLWAKSIEFAHLYVSFLLIRPLFFFYLFYPFLMLIIHNVTTAVSIIYPPSKDHFAAVARLPFFFLYLTLLV